MDTIALSCPTHPGSVARAAVERPEQVAVRFKEHGSWVTWSRQHYAAVVGRSARRLLALGVRPGDRVGLVGPTSPGWVTAALAVQAAGGIIVGAYPTAAAAQLEESFGGVAPRIVLAGEVADPDGVATAVERLASVEGVLGLDPAGTARGARPRWPLLSDGGVVNDVSGLGTDEEAVQFLGDLTSRLRPDDPCTLIFTSGTTGTPKAAMHSYSSIGQIADTVAPALGYQTDDEYLVYLPLSHAAEQSNTLVVGGHLGWTLNFAQSMDTIFDDLPDIRPTVMFGVPRVFEKIGERCLEALATEPDGSDRLRTHGLDRLRVVLGGGAPMAEGLIAFFAEHGIVIRNSYGMTEGNGIAMPWRTPPRVDTVGTPLPGVEVKLAPDGEILVRSHGVCVGYYGDPEGTAALRDEDGFLRTGDVGEFTADGELRLIDRKRDIIITSGGKNMSPSVIERALTAEPHIRRAIVVGNDRPYLAALLALDLAALEEWMAAQPAIPPSPANFAERPEVLALIASEVAAVNTQLSRPEQIKRWAVLPPESAGAEPELTSSMKLRRSEYHRQYHALIEALYEGVAQ